MRLNRYLAAAGLGSRRACEVIISEGRVAINGHVCTALPTVVGPTDAVKVDNHLVRAQASVHVMLNKPVGFLSTRTDPRQRETVFDLLPGDFPRLFHVGRLDRDSEGLLLLTNDGDLALRLTHPRYKVDKEYEVTLDRAFDMTLTQRLLAGVFIAVDTEEGQPTRRVRAKAEAIHRIGGQTLKVILRQGLKRQIRLMFLAVGYEVRQLRRVRLGPLRLGKLRPGEWRYLEEKEAATLKAKPQVAEREAKKSRPAGGRIGVRSPGKSAPSARDGDRRPRRG